MRISRANHALSGWICNSCKHRFQASQARRTNSTNTRKARLPDTPARTRFAPSPTGNLHLGSIRTALFNYLLARRTKGQFLLRIEDTDQKRTIPGAEERLFEDLQWAGLHWNDGPLVGGSYGPYRQSERTQLYQEHVKPLLQNGKAYRCFCSAERIKSFNEARHAEGLPLGYDRKCKHVALAEAEDRAHNGESHVIRFLVPKEYPRYHDLIYGKSGHGSNKTKKLLLESPVYDDPILLKSDGFPTYHFANIVDDHLMKITHVIRGSEWMTSTPLHIALYEAFAWAPPEYAHVPLLVDKTGAKLSKRNADTDIASFRARGIFPEALTNFTALLGWSHQGKNDVMDLAELSETFDLKITKGNTIVSFEKTGVPARTTRSATDYRRRRATGPDGSRCCRGSIREVWRCKGDGTPRIPTTRGRDPLHVAEHTIRLGECYHICRMGRNLPRRPPPIDCVRRCIYCAGNSHCGIDTTPNADGAMDDADTSCESGKS